jgi:hypothetical protein
MAWMAAQWIRLGGQGAAVVEGGGAWLEEEGRRASDRGYRQRRRRARCGEGGGRVVEWKGLDGVREGVVEGKEEGDWGPQAGEGRTHVGEGSNARRGGGRRSGERMKVLSFFFSSSYFLGVEILTTITQVEQLSIGTQHKGKPS